MRPHTRHRQQGLTLIELLAAMAIATVLSTMLVMAWISLQGSYAYSVDSAQQRNEARQAIDRLAAEIRDVESHDPGPGIELAQPNEIKFYTTFNNAGNTDPTLAPVEVDYLLANGIITRQEGTLGALTLVQHVVNQRQPSSSNPTPLFMYSYVDSSGTIQQASSVTGDENLTRIIGVQIHLMIDLNPNHSPTYMDMLTTALPRNQRQF